MSIVKPIPIDYFKCVKVPLKHVLKHYDVNSAKITESTIKCNKIIIHTLQFMKLYLIICRLSFS